MSRQESEQEQEEILVWQKDTWGNYGQHSNKYTFVIDLTTLETKAIYELVTVRHVNQDSRKNLHRYTYAKVSDIIANLQGKVIKQVHDYASSSRKTVNVKYYLVTQQGLKELETEKGLRDSEGFYDKVKVNGKTLIVRKDKVEISA